MHRRIVLVVDDQEINRKTLGKILDKDYELLYAENGIEALSIMKEKPELSVVLLDILMPVMDGYQVLKEMAKDPQLSKIPVIVSSQRDDDESEVKALALGAQDFIAKPYKADIIRHRVDNTIKFRETASMINKTEKDTLTNLYSKPFFLEKAKQTLKLNPEDSFQMCSFGVERFKLINDTYGDKVGDQVLCYIAKVIREMMQPTDVYGRFGSDEFYVLFRRTPEEIATGLEEFSRRVNEFPIDMAIKINSGIYNVQRDEQSVMSMCDRAKLAADANKGKYDSPYTLYDDSFIQKLVDEEFITSNMKSALKENQFEVYYQPKYDLVSEKIVGAEALVRWIHPEKGILSPGLFIPIFERNGFIKQLDQFVWRRVCQNIRQWLDDGYPELAVSVNVSRVDIYDPKLTEIIVGLVEEYNVPLKCLHLEITESAYSDNPEQIIYVVSRFRELGFIIEMDDFGSGYSSLNILAKMPVDVLKMDMKFVQTQSLYESGKGIMNFVISLAKWMNLVVVAEGVETAEQILTLRGMDCNYVQGFYFAKPMPLEQFKQLVKSSDVAEMIIRSRNYHVDVEKVNHIITEKGKELLIVDDIEMNRAILTATFMDDYAIVEKENGQDAWEYLVKNFEKVDAVLLDLMMPVMDGFHLLKKIRTDKDMKNLPVVITSIAGEEGEGRAVELGADDFIAKPYKIDIIKRRVRNVIYSRKYMEELEEKGRK